MKKKLKIVPVIACLLVFAGMAIGSSSGDSDTKSIVGSDSAAGGEKVTIEEQVLLDESGIVVTAREYSTDSFWGDGIKVVIENNSDKNVTVSCNSLIVNDYMINNTFAENVAAGKKVNSTIYLSSNELKAAGIATVGKIEVYFHVHDSDTYRTLFDSDCAVIRTSQYDNMDITPDDAGTELYNADGIRIVGKAVDEKSFWGAAILLYIENESGSNVIVQCDNMSVNGYMVTPLFSCTVYDGKKAIDDISVLSQELKDNGVTGIENVELTFRIADSDTYRQIAESGTINFSAK